MDTGAAGRGHDRNAPAGTAYTLQGVMRFLPPTVDRAEAEQGQGGLNLSPPALDVHIPNAQTPPDVDNP
jgi:hypothetical protein